MIAAEILKPSLWCPGRNPYAHELWRGCVGYWPLWEGVGDTVHDLSPHGRKGTLTNMTPATDWVIGQRGLALDFDGSNDHVSIPVVTVTASPFSLMTLSKVAGVTATYVTMSINDAGSTDDQCFIGFGGAVAGDPVRFGVRTGGTFDYADSTTPYTADTWHTIIGVCVSDTERHVYLDGTSKGSTVASVTPTGWNRTWIGGLGDSTPQYYQSQIALAVLWDRALSDAEAAEIGADPFCMIRQPDFSPFWDVAAAAGGGPFPHFLRRSKALTGGLVGMGIQ